MMTTLISVHAFHSGRILCEEYVFCICSQQFKWQICSHHIYCCYLSCQWHYRRLISVRIAVFILSVVFSKKASGTSAWGVVLDLTWCWNWRDSMDTPEFGNLLIIGKQILSVNILVSRYYQWTLVSRYYQWTYW